MLKLAKTGSETVYISSTLRSSQDGVSSLIVFVHCVDRRGIRQFFDNVSEHSERLAAGKLPAKWHMPSRIEEDIGKERTKMDELQAELRKLELQTSHIQHLIDHGYGGEDEMGDEDDEMGDEVDETQIRDEDDGMRDVEDSNSDILDVGNLPLGVE